MADPFNISAFKEIFQDSVVPLIIILVLIAVLRWIQTLQKKGTEIRIYKAPS